MRVSVRVKAGARRETVRRISETRFELDVKERPERNKANQRVVELVALQFGAMIKSVRIVKGHHVSSKVLSIVTHA